MRINCCWRFFAEGLSGCRGEQRIIRSLRREERNYDNYRWYRSIEIGERVNRMGLDWSIESNGFLKLDWNFEAEIGLEWILHRRVVEEAQPSLCANSTEVTRNVNGECAWRRYVFLETFCKSARDQTDKRGRRLGYRKIQEVSISGELIALLRDLYDVARTLSRTVKMRVPLSSQHRDASGWRREVTRHARRARIIF